MITTSSPPIRAVNPSLLRWLPAAHLALSCAVALLAAALVFLLWYPYPLSELTGGSQLFLMIVGIDVICGPLLTWVLIKPGKTRRAIAVDLALVAVIQLAALVYGLNTMAYARPVALVHEVDRFKVVSYADIAANELADAPAWAQPWQFAAPQVIGVRSPRTEEEKLDSVDLALAGADVSVRPSWWQAYDLKREHVLERARPIADLLAKHPDQQALIDATRQAAAKGAAAGETHDPDALKWLPVTGRFAVDWIAYIDPATARIRGYANVDGF